MLKHSKSGCSIARITAAIRSLLPLRWREPVTTYAREVDAVLSQFMRGQLTVMAILAVLYSVAYAIIGVRLAVPIGIVAGLLNFIPYLGGAFALVAGVLMTLLGGGGFAQCVAVVVAYALIQTLEGFVLTPRIVGLSKNEWFVINPDKPTPTRSRVI